MTNINVNACNLAGGMPLHHAVSRNSVVTGTILKILLEVSSVDVNAADRRGETPLRLAISSSCHTSVKKLLKAPKIDVNAADNNGNTPLHIAAKNNYSRELNTLLEAPNINVNASDNESWTPLHVAASRKHVEATKLLLVVANINANAVSNDGTTVLHLAVTNRSIGVTKLLCEHQQRYKIHTAASRSGRAAENNAEHLREGHRRQWLNAFIRSSTQWSRRPGWGGEALCVGGGAEPQLRCRRLSLAGRYRSIWSQNAPELNR